MMPKIKDLCNLVIVFGAIIWFCLLVLWDGMLGKDSLPNC